MVLGASMITTVVVAACGARTGLPVGESVVVADAAPPEAGPDVVDAPPDVPPDRK